MAHDTPRLGMRIRANRPGFTFGSERVIQHSFQSDILPEIAQQQQNMKDSIAREEFVERTVMNQPSLGEDKFMMPFQAISEKDRLKLQTQRDIQKGKGSVDADVPESELETMRKNINSKIW